jgi:hypothetical protein
MVVSTARVLEMKESGGGRDDEAERRGGERRMVRVQWRAFGLTVGEDVEDGSGSAGTMRHRRSCRELTAARRGGEVVASTAVEWRLWMGCR